MIKSAKSQPHKIGKPVLILYWLIQYFIRSKIAKTRPNLWINSGSNCSFLSILFVYAMHHINACKLYGWKAFELDSSRFTSEKFTSPSLGLLIVLSTKNAGKHYARRDWGSIIFVAMTNNTNIKKQSNSKILQQSFDNLPRFHWCAPNRTHI